MSKSEEKINFNFIGVKLQQLIDKVAGLHRDVRAMQRSLDNFRNEMSGFRSETMHRFDEQDEKFANLVDRLDRYKERIEALEDKAHEP